MVLVIAGCLCYLGNRCSDDLCDGHWTQDTALAGNPTDGPSDILLVPNVHPGLLKG